MKGTESQNPYGPNTSRVRRFLVQLAALGEADRNAVCGEYDRLSRTSTWAAAEAELGRIMEASGRSELQTALSGPFLQLVGSGDTEDAPGQIAEPALGAVLAIVLSDLLPAEQFTTLYEPFARTIPVSALG